MKRKKHPKDIFLIGAEKEIKEALAADRMPDPKNAFELATIDRGLAVAALGLFEGVVRRAHRSLPALKSRSRAARAGTRSKKDRWMRLTNAEIEFLRVALRTFRLTTVRNVVRVLRRGRGTRKARADRAEQRAPSLRWADDMIRSWSAAGHRLSVRELWKEAKAREMGIGRDLLAQRLRAFRNEGKRGR